MLCAGTAFRPSSLSFFAVQVLLQIDAYPQIKSALRRIHIRQRSDFFQPWLQGAAVQIELLGGLGGVAFVVETALQRVP